MRTLFALLLASPLFAAPLITVEYRDKPPYSYTQDGKPRGFLLERTVEIFRRANIPVAFIEIPVKRITADIQANLKPICSPSWYKLPERELFARFSLPIHQDKPHVILAGTHAVDAIRKLGSIKALFASPNFTLGAVDGVSYGPELDKLIADMPKPAMRATVPPLQLARMIKAKRADYMLIDQEDLAFLDQQGEVTAEGMVKVEFPDAPAGLKRYLMCSKQVDTDTLAQIDKAVKAVVPELNP